MTFHRQSVNFRRITQRHSSKSKISNCLFYGCPRFVSMINLTYKSNLQLLTTINDRTNVQKCKEMISLLNLLQLVWGWSAGLRKVEFTLKNDRQPIKFKLYSAVLTKASRPTRLDNWNANNRSKWISSSTVSLFMYRPDARPVDFSNWSCKLLFVHAFRRLIWTITS